MEPVEPTLYSALAQSVPPSTERGETRITATKETIDDDREELDGLLLGDRG
jgi:hypothetical protein